MIKRIFVCVFVIICLSFSFWLFRYGGHDSYFEASVAKTCEPSKTVSIDPPPRGENLVVKSSVCIIVEPLLFLFSVGNIFRAVPFLGLLAYLAFYGAVFFLIALLLIKIRVLYLGITVGLILLVLPPILMQVIYHHNPCPDLAGEDLLGCQGAGYEEVDHYYWQQVFNLANVDPNSALANNPKYNPRAELDKIKKACLKITYPSRQEECKIYSDGYAKKFNLGIY